VEVNGILIMRKRSMPSKKKILYYWDDFGLEVRKDTCFACGFPARTHRCHLLAKDAGGTDSIDNLVLLCSACHSVQETFACSPEKAEKFKNALIDGALFMTAKMHYYKALVDYGVISLPLAEATPEHQS